jgi:hypothetical protein
MDKKYTNIKERLLYFAKNQEIGIENFLQKIGMTYGSFKGKAKNGSLNSNAIVEIYTLFPEISIEWLLTGKGSMLKDGGSSGVPVAAQPPPNDSIVAQLQKDNEMQAKLIASLERENELLREKLQEKSQPKINTIKVVKEPQELETGK